MSITQIVILTFSLTVLWSVVGRLILAHLLPDLGDDHTLPAWMRRHAVLRRLTFFALGPVVWFVMLLVWYLESTGDLDV